MFLPLCLALFATFFSTIFFPNLHLMTFAPFLALAFQRFSFIGSLWTAFLCGLLLDLFSSEMSFGMNALSMTVATLLLYRQKKHFYEDKPLSLSLFTAFISLAVTACQIALTASVQKKYTLTWQWLGADLLLMPFIDALYAFVWFTCPLRIFNMRRA